MITAKFSEIIVNITFSKPQMLVITITFFGEKPASKVCDILIAKDIGYLSFS